MTTPLPPLPLLPPRSPSSPKGSPPNPYILGTRSSHLALLQTHLALSALSAAHPSLSFTLLPMSVQGDKNQVLSLQVLGGPGKAVWTEELEDALFRGEVDMIVHSLKDLPTVLRAGTEIACVMEREDPVDSVVVKRGTEGKWMGLGGMPEGSVVGTSSVRRQAQLRRAFPHLKFMDVRGNLNTRLAKLDAEDGPYAALVLARAGLVRMGWEGRVEWDVGPPVMMHAVGQGAIAIQTLSPPPPPLPSLLAPLTHLPTLYLTTAERALLSSLEGGCSVPIGVGSSLADGVLTLSGSVTSPTSPTHISFSHSAPVSSLSDAEAIGREVGKGLRDAGAEEVLEEVGRERERRVREVEEGEEARGKAS